MAFDEKTGRTVIGLLHDGQRGLLSDELKDHTAKTFFRDESVNRAQFASELEAALSAETGKNVEEGGTATGTIHRN